MTLAAKLAAFDVSRLSRYPDHSFAKYLADTPTWVRANERRVSALGLDRVRRHRVLDIGTGCGFFPYLCREHGHEIVALDAVRRRSVYREITALLDVPVIDHDVAPRVPLPDLGTFDVIAAFMVTFNGHAGVPWGVDEWRFLIADARSRLRRNGAIVLELNREPETDSCYTPELRAAFVEMGAEITGHWPHAPAEDGHRLTFKSTDPRRGNTL